jgi:tetratricopeptide (TPR) repeat protein
MALRDSAGNLSSSTSPKALEYFDQSLDDFMHFRGALMENINASIHSDPNFALGYAYKAYVGVLGTEPNDAAATKIIFDKYLANTNLSALHPREKQHLEAATTLLNGDFHRAGQQLASISRDYPRDILSLSVGHQIDFFTGNTAMLFDRISNALPAWTAQDKYYSNMLGMLSFGLEEAGHYDRAEEVGLEAVERNPKNVWGIHAVSHTYEMQANFSKGMNYLDARLSDWATGNFFLNHNWWHYALYTLEAGRYERALQIHDTVLFTQDTSDIALQLLDATALCWRLYLEGHDVSERFAKHAELWKRKVEPAFYAFNDMHMVMAFVGAGLEPEAEALIISREQFVSKEQWLAKAESLVAVHNSVNSNIAMTRDIGLPICKAVLAFGRGEYAKAAAYLYPIRHRLHEFGGSHAQRDVVLQTLLEASLRSSNHVQTKEILNERFVVKPRSPYNWLKQAALLEHLGQNLEAVTARDTALLERKQKS